MNSVVFSRITETKFPLTPLKRNPNPKTQCRRSRGFKIIGLGCFYYSNSFFMSNGYMWIFTTNYSLSQLKKAVSLLFPSREVFTPQLTLTGSLVRETKNRISKGSETLTWIVFFQSLWIKRKQQIKNHHQANCITYRKETFLSRSSEHARFHSSSSSTDIPPPKKN